MINANSIKADQKKSLREERIILRKIPKLRKEFGSFAIKRQRLVSGLDNKVCNETVRNSLKKKGYKFLHSRKKELLKLKDLKERLKFSRKIKVIFKYLRKISGLIREYHSIWMD